MFDKTVYSGKGDAVDALGQRIVRLRRERRWKQAELARRVGVTRECLSHWERGAATPPLTALVALRSLFRVSLDELVTGETRGRWLSAEEWEMAGRYLEEFQELLGLRGNP